jgi:hypothetical protein
MQAQHRPLLQAVGSQSTTMQNLPAAGHQTT